MLSGRREVEILNVSTGRSSFVAHGPTSVLFKGQAKKPGEWPAYVVPLLCAAGTFLDAIAVLQAKRGDMSQLDNAQVKRKHNGGMQAVDLLRVFPNLPSGAHFHTLRSIYFHGVHSCYEHTLAYNHLAKLLLGHSSETESLSYTCVRLDGLEAMRGTFGALDLSVAGDEL